MQKIWKLAIVAALLASAGCASAYYGSMEKLGFEKRDILVDRVKAARGEQADAQKTFTSALEEFRSLVDVDGGDLERQYDKIKLSYERSKNQAGDVRSRIKAVDNVGKRLFKEWEAELKLYDSADLRRRSAQQLDTTHANFAKLLTVMNRAASKMDPVLELYQDQVLFLKHNLNARAISLLETERVKIEERVAVLIEEMNEAIAEADAFIATMK